MYLYISRHNDTFHLNNNYNNRNSKICTTMSDIFQLFSANKSIETLSTHLSRKINKTSFIQMTPKRLHLFFQALDHPFIKKLLEVDRCFNFIDRYLLAMVLIYFVRADKLPTTCILCNFFVALYLAHEMEEENEEIRTDIMVYHLGRDWKNLITVFRKKRLEFWQALNYEAYVSRDDCETILNIFSKHHSAFLRQRCHLHYEVVKEFTRCKLCPNPSDLSEYVEESRAFFNPLPEDNILNLYVPL